MLSANSIFNVLLVFLFGELDKHFAYFLFIHIVYLFLNHQLQKQHYYLENVTHSPYHSKALTPLFILILCNALDQQIADYFNFSFRNLFSLVYTIFILNRISPFLHDETAFFPKIIICVTTKLHNKIIEILSKA